MKFEDWKELVKSEPLDVQLSWLLNSYESYVHCHEQIKQMWHDLWHTSMRAKGSECYIQRTPRAQQKP